jgi:hypothetical protein
MILAVNHLGLAAYIKMCGGQLLSVSGKTFTFESDRPLSDWRVEYSNSCCSRHDSILCELRQHLNQ